MATSRRHTIGLVIGAAVLVIASSTTSAVATKFITGADIKDRSITGADIKPDSVPGNRLEPGSVKLEHLHPSAVRAGEVYTSRRLDSNLPAKRMRGSSPLKNSWTEVSSLINVPSGTYLAVITGRYDFDPSSESYLAIECQLQYPSSAANLMFYSGAGSTSIFYGTVADSIVFKSSAKGTVQLNCMTEGDYTGDLSADIVLIPVSTYYQP